MVLRRGRPRRELVVAGSFRPVFDGPAQIAVRVRNFLGIRAGEAKTGVGW